ncbi:MAG: radical SAM protein [Coriobacteriia bacterium]|nr:radical SAM protein [Coriobacteriia bacterium]
MRILEKTPAGLRDFARRVLPAGIVDDVRDALMHHNNQQSMVSREPWHKVRIRRHILRRKPVLYHFEIHITDHCNLNCRGCAHFSNLCKPTFADLTAFESDMRAMAEHFSAVEQIYLLGGEPLLHPRIADFVMAARKIFPETRIYLMTNGTLVTRMKNDFWKAMADTRTILLADSYPIGLPVDEIDRLGREHEVTVEWTDPRSEFFKIPIDSQGGHDARDSFRRCQGYNNCPIVREGKLYPCAYVAFADVFKERFGLPGLDVTEADYVDIHREHNPERIMDFLLHAVPWCSNCDMQSLEFHKWGRSERDVAEWT